jgi:hypothetical protein
MEHPTDGKPRLVLTPGRSIVGPFAALVGRDRNRFDFDPNPFALRDDAIDTAFQTLRSVLADPISTFASAIAGFGQQTRRASIVFGGMTSAARFHAQGYPRSYRPAAGRYKGSAMARRATRRGGNPARSGLARLPPP